MPIRSNVVRVVMVAGLLVSLGGAASCGSQSTNSGGNGGSSGGGSTSSGGSSGSPTGSGSGSGSGSGGVQSSGSGGGSSSSSSSSGAPSSGSGSSSGSSSSSSSGATAHGGTTPPDLPTAMGTCPTLATGDQAISLNGTSMSWTLWVGSKAATATGPIVIYWHATGTSSSEAQTALGSNISTITGLGGIVASADSTTSTGTDTGDGVWFTGDINWADFIIACAIKQLNIDTTHIHAAGYSAGALQTGYMWYSRSGYLASAIVYSGGVIFAPAQQDPSNAPSLIGAHGSTAADAGGCTNLLSTTCDALASSTESFESAAVSAGAPMVIDCDDGQDHVYIERLSNLAPMSWPFFKAHPFGQGKPDPYASGLPSGFPSYCKIE
jgi:hypothetical protein